MKRDSEHGYTIIELLVTMGIIFILGATAVYNLKEMNHPIKNAADGTEHFLHLARSRAISGTEVVKVSVASTTTLTVETSNSCTGTMTDNPSLFLELPAQTMFIDTSVTVCFTQRGLADANASFVIADIEGNQSTVRVALGGGTIIE